MSLGVHKYAANNSSTGVKYTPGLKQLNDFVSFVHTSDIYAFAIIETWLRAYILDDTITPTGFTIRGMIDIQYSSATTSYSQHLLLSTTVLNDNSLLWVCHVQFLVKTLHCYNFQKEFYGKNIGSHLSSLRF